MKVIYAGFKLKIYLQITNYIIKAVPMGTCAADECRKQCF